MEETKKTLSDEELNKTAGGFGGACPKGLSYMNMNSCYYCSNKSVVTETEYFIYYHCPYADGQIGMTNSHK